MNQNSNMPTERMVSDSAQMGSFSASLRQIRAYRPALNRWNAGSAA